MQDQRLLPEVISVAQEIQTGLPTGVATMAKQYFGQIEGRSTTLFTAAFDPASGRGAYCAMESFDGALHGKRGTFNFIHSAATSGKDRTNEFFSIVEGSGTGDLSAIEGTGGMRIDPDGTHHIWFDVGGLA
ncbi:MAG: DUF3224 domain-containing protein [Rheinheimera sp.]|nr:DUF3224 domain-containing protein [Rheinheimera sp.]